MGIYLELNGDYKPPYNWGHWGHHPVAGSMILVFPEYGWQHPRHWTSNQSHMINLRHCRFLIIDAALTMTTVDSSGCLDSHCKPQHHDCHVKSSVDFNFRSDRGWNMCQPFAWRIRWSDMFLLPSFHCHMPGHAQVVGKFARMDALQ